MRNGSDPKRTTEAQLAELEAGRQQQILVATVIRPAEAKRDADIAAAEAASRVAELTAEGQAKRVELEANAKAAATRASSSAEADAAQAKGRGEAEATRALGLAEADAAQAKGRAEGEAIRARGLAEGEAIRARGLAEAEAIKARSDALAANPEAVAMQQLAEHWPAIVHEAAGAFAHVGNFTVLNGAEGVNQALMQVAGVGLSSYEFLRGLFVPRGGTAAHAAAPAVVPGAEDARRS